MNYIRLTAGNHNLYEQTVNFQQRMIERVNVICDSTNGAINITLPRLQDVRNTLNYNFIFDDVAGTSATNNITIFCGSGDKINFNATSIVLNTAYQKMFIQQSKNDPDSGTSGNWIALYPQTSGSGSVTSVGLTTSPVGMFTVTNSPITTSGNIDLDFGTKNANTVLAGPASGGAASPSFRALVLADLPAGVGTGTVTSVAMTVPNIFAIAGSPITTTGTLAVTLATQSANLVFAGPTTGSAATPTFRALVTADLPAGVGSGTVTSVGLSSPSIFTVSGSPVTSSGTLSFSLNSQEPRLFFAGPLTGSPAAPTFRVIAWSDMPESTKPKVTVNNSSTLTLDSTATTWVYTGSSPATWSLPTVGAGNIDTLYFIKNRGSATITLDVVGGSATIYNTSAVINISITAGSAVTIQQDGTYWIVL